MKLNHSELMSFFYGTLLGDSSIHNGAFECKQINEDLINFKFKIIKKYIPSCNPTIKFLDVFTDKNGVNRKPCWTLRTSAHPFFKKLEKLFYPNGKIVLPNGILDKLDTLGYAMWFADDGTTIQVGYNEVTKSSTNRRIEFCTDAYNKQEVDIILNHFKNKFGSAKIINRNKNNQYRVRLGTYEGQQLLIDISPYFYKYFPSLLYKLDMGYRNESLNSLRYVNPLYKELYFKISTHNLFIDRLKQKGYDIV